MSKEDKHNYSDYSEVLAEAIRLLNIGDKGQSDYISANFRLGGVVAYLQDNAQYGDNAVVRLAEDLTKKRGYTVYPQRLWECARVWRAFNGDVQKIWALEKKLQIKITWSFLIKNCTPSIPNPCSDMESKAFWDKKLSIWENTIEEINSTIANKDKLVEQMSPAVKEQFEGFIRKIENPKFAPIPNNKLTSLFRRIDALLDECLDGKVKIDEGMRKYLESVQEKIEKLLVQAFS